MLVYIVKLAQAKEECRTVALVLESRATVLRMFCRGTCTCQCALQEHVVAQYNVLHGSHVYVHCLHVEVQCTSSLYSSCASHFTKLPMCDLKATTYIMGPDESRT